jgi:uncharacterized membrane protein YuzA (DUF378 family)
MNYLRSVQHYETGFEDGRRQAQSERRHGSVMTTLVASFFRIFFLIVLMSPGLFSAYFILAAVKHDNAHLTGWTYGWTFVAVVFVLECGMFFLKGCGMALQKRNSPIWIIPWVICALYGFALPVYGIHIFGYNLFKPVLGNPTGTLNLVTWVVAGLAGIYVYSRFHFTRPNVPRWAGWAHRIGRGL